MHIEIGNQRRKGQFSAGYFTCIQEVCTSFSSLIVKKKDFYSIKNNYKFIQIYIWHYLVIYFLVIKTHLL